MPCRAQTLQKEMKSLHTLIRSTIAFIYLQYRVLLEIFFSNLNELFCNNEMMRRSALFWTNTLSWICIVIAHWNNIPQIDMSLHSDTLSRFQANQCLLLQLNTATVAEWQQKQIVLYSKPHQWCNSPRVVENMIVICIARVLSIEAKPHQWCKSPRVVENMIVIP
jgi:predicted nucleotidyltransferase